LDSQITLRIAKNENEKSVKAISKIQKVKNTLSTSKINCRKTKKQAMNANIS
jgi:hypothetical protein